MPEPENTQKTDDLNVLLSNLQDKLASTNAMRDPIISKVYDVVSKMNIDFENSSPRVIEQQISLITKLDDLLKSKENNSINSVKMAMNKKNSDSLTNLAELSVNVLRQIAPSSVLKKSEFISTDPTEEELEAQLKDEKSLNPITDAELQISELPNTEIQK